MKVLLIGMTNSGKSTLGAELARRWGCAYHDVDQMIEALYSCLSPEPKSVREIYADHGAEAFADLESRAVTELFFLLDGPGESLVASVGGNTVTCGTARKLLDHLVLTVWLEVDPEVLYDRLTHKGAPAFLDGPDPRAQFLDLCRRRGEHYRRLADLRVDLTGLDVAAASGVPPRRRRVFDLKRRPARTSLWVPARTTPGQHMLTSRSR